MRTTEKFNQEYITFHVDGLKLKGVLHLPDDKPSPVVIGSHGLYSSSSSPKQIALAEQCNRFGIAYFRFDHRGCGNSEGEFDRVTSLEARCRDLIAAVKTINSKIDAGRLGLFGSSMGGTVCLRTAGRLAASSVVTFAAPIRSDLTGSQSEMSRSEIVFDAARRPFDVTELLSAISNILIFHGDADDVVPVSHAREIYTLARQPKQIIIQKHGDHPMSNAEHQKEFVRETAAWFKQWLKRS
ncbi:MAG: alpha/beta fold hydrolase [Desulfobacteraceae bacterium]|jgi:alpha-beta hydrolase superfamily lysophospholipase|nr:alpha/beta fold hydrolase [Desulfobacteraceae bacterium]